MTFYIAPRKKVFSLPAELEIRAISLTFLMISLSNLLDNECCRFWDQIKSKKKCKSSYVWWALHSWLNKTGKISFKNCAGLFKCLVCKYFFVNLVPFSEETSFWPPSMVYISVIITHITHITMDIPLTTLEPHYQLDCLTLF